jgi:hypothetical protein
MARNSFDDLPGSPEHPGANAAIGKEWLEV